MILDTTAATRICISFLAVNYRDALKELLPLVQIRCGVFPRPFNSTFYL